MNHPLIVRRDLDFLLHDWLCIDTSGDVDRDAVDAVLDLSEKLAVEQFLPHYKPSDIAEPRLIDGQVRILPAIGDALARYADLGLFAASFAPELGGLGLSYVVCTASFAYFAAANIATAAYPMLTTANARLIVAFGLTSQIDAFARPQIEGRWFGTMCLSEPQAGSSLADICTRAARVGDDIFGARYRLTGNKMWISGGDQDASANIVHLVLAKIETDGKLPEGTAGLSLFIVPKWLPDGTRNDVTVAGLNHKMGYRGTANCLLNLGERGGATGWLVGEEGAGLRQMFLMMNEARIGVGIGAAALGYRGYRHAVAYARERLQGRPIGERGGSPVAIIHHPDVKRLLLAQKSYAEGALALCLYAATLVDDGDDPDSVGLLGLLIPVVKTWSSEYGLAANDLAIQVHGGYGYTRDFDVEQLYRDNRLNPIHEGTTGIQAIDLLGRKVLRDAGCGLRELRRRIADTVARAAERLEWQPAAAALADTWSRVAASIDSLRAIDGAPAFDNATPFLSAFGHAVVGWLWLDLALAATTHPDKNFAEGKRRACRFFFDHELPRVAAWLSVTDKRSDAAAGASPDIF